MSDKRRKRAFKKENPVPERQDLKLENAFSMSRQSTEICRNNRAKAIKYHKALREIYGSEIFSKSRKRDTVLKRRMIVTFFIKEKEFTGYFVAKVFNINYQSVFYFMKPIIDKEFERFYRLNIEALRENFEKIDNHVISS